MYSFTFRQVQVFLEICRAENFSGAAERLDVSQPAISGIVRTLEAQLGVKLFERRRGASSVLTREGELFRDSAQQFMGQCELISRKRQPPRSLRVYIGSHLLDDYIRPMLPEFYDEHPAQQMNFLPEKSRDRILQDIQDDKIDIALISVPPDERPKGAVFVGTVPTGVFGIRAFRSATTPEAISALPFLLPATGSQLAASMLRTMERCGVRPTRIAGNFPYHELMVRLACRGKGVMFAALTVVEKHDTRGLLKPLMMMEDWERRLYISPRVKPGLAAAIASFFTRALAGSPSGT